LIRSNFRGFASALTAARKRVNIEHRLNFGRTNQGGKMPLITIEDMLRTAPTDSKEFKIALGAIEEMIRAEERAETQDATLDGYLAVIRDRFRSGEELTKLEAVVGACNVVGIFACEIDLDLESLTEGSRHQVNTYAMIHLRSCERCGCTFSFETLRRNLSAKTPTCAAQEN